MRFIKCLFGLVLLALLPAPCRGKVDPEAVNRAIDRGVALLKKNQQSDGSWRWGHPMDDFGMTSLVGLTLMHCGVPATDPSVVKASDYVHRLFRANEANIFALRGATQNYAISLAVLFLDRLGDAGDEALIRKLTALIVGGQKPDGGWNHWLDHSRDNPNDPGGRGTDNSNTQFALLALWAGQRHGARVSWALAASAKRFYVSQGRDGGWGYLPPWDSRVPIPTYLSMTGSGLLALAYHHAAANKAILQRPTGRRALAKTFHDRAVVAGLKHIKMKFKPALTYGLVDGHDSNANCNLWMVERVAAAYDLETISGLDWYDEAARFLVAGQREDGSWPGSWGLAETCFALLTLRRANLSPDVTALLKGQLPREPLWSMAARKKPEHEPDLASKDIREALRQTAVSVDKKADAAAIQTLLKELAQADDSQRDRLLHLWRDGEDERYTPALAKAIATLSGPAERKARAALADRLTRLTVHERDEYLRSDDPEIRRAAVLSCALRDDHQHLARLIELLQDKEELVAHAAHAVLCSLTGKDFGPDADASQADRDRAVSDWKEWAKKNGQLREEKTLWPRPAGTTESTSPEGTLAPKDSGALDRVSESTPLSLERSPNHFIGGHYG